MVSVALDRRSGKSTLAALLSLLLVAVLLYYGVEIGKVYWNYYKLTDAMELSARFAGGVDDEVILSHLRQIAGELDLPAEAKQFRITRVGRPPLITILTRYSVVVELPFHNRVIRFHPTAVAQRFQ